MSVQEGDYVEITSQYIIVKIRINEILILPVDDYKTMFKLIPKDNQWMLESLPYNQKLEFNINPKVIRTENKLHINDYVNITSKYIIKEMNDNEIIISPVDNYDILLILEPIDNQWKLKLRPYNQSLVFKKNEDISKMNYDIIDLSILPPELITMTMIDRSLKEIKKLCLTNSYYNELLCDNDSFWRLKFKHDYGFIPSNIKSGKKLYETYGLYRLNNFSAGRPLTEIELYPKQIKDFSGYNDKLYFIDINNNLYHMEAYLYNIMKNKLKQITQHKVKKVSTSYHTMFIDEYNNIYSFGVNNYGQLGFSDTYDAIFPLNISEPRQIENIEAKEVSTGNDFSLVIDVKDNVLSFGINKYCELGLDNNIEQLTDIYGNRYRYIPTIILNPITNQPIKAKQISAGFTHSLLIDMNNNVWSFGDNEEGQLGLGHTKPICRLSQIINPETNIPIMAKFIEAGRDTSFIIDMDDELWAFGYNFNGHLGINGNGVVNIPTRVGIKAKYVSAGPRITLAINMEDNMISFGNNSSNTIYHDIKVTKVSAKSNYPIILGYPSQR